MDNNSDTGVKINLISSRKLDSMNSQEKLRFIIDEIKKGTVLVLERGLTAEEEIDLIKTTMSEINHQTFIGIEMQSYSAQDLAADSWINKLLGRTRVPRMSVIGPANLLKTIYKNGSIIQAMILTGQSIVDNLPEDDRGEPGTEAEIDAEATEAVTEPGTEAFEPRAGAGLETEATADSEPGPTESQDVGGPEQYSEPVTEPVNSVVPEQVSSETAPAPEHTIEQQIETTSSEYSKPSTTPVETLPPEQPPPADEAPPPADPNQPLPPPEQALQTEQITAPPEQSLPADLPTQEQAQNQDQSVPPPEQSPQTEPGPVQDVQGTGFLYKRIKQEEE